MPGTKQIPCKMRTQPHILWAEKKPTHGGFMIFTETYGNGLLIIMIVIITKEAKKYLHPALKKAARKLSVEARGTLTNPTAEQQQENPIHLITAAVPSDSGLFGK